VKGVSTRLSQKKAHELGVSGSWGKRVLQFKVSQRILEFLAENHLVRDIDLENAGQYCLPMHLAEKMIPSCLVTSRILEKSNPRPQTREVPILLEKVNGLTLCFACVFVREKYSGMRNSVFLDSLREIVADTLRGLGYSLEENQGTDLQKVLPDWEGCPEWWCLAKKQRAVRTALSSSRELQLVVA